MSLTTKLASIYNHSLFEKTASDMLAEQLGAQGLDTSSISPDQLEMAAQQILTEAEAQSAEQSQEQVAPQMSPEEQAQLTGTLQEAQKVDYQSLSPEQLQQTQLFQTGDALGKIAAHSTWATFKPMADEYFSMVLGEVAKTAGFADKARSAAWGARDAVRSAGSAVSGAAKRYGNLMAGGGEAGVRPGNHLSTLKGSYAGRKVNPSEVSEARKSLGARVGTAVGLGAAGAGAYHMAKEASALNTLAWNKVQGFLAQNGIDVNELLAQQEQTQAEPQVQDQMMSEAQKMANDMRSMVDSHTDEMALEILKSLGIDLSQQEQVQDPTQVQQVA